MFSTYGKPAQVDGCKKKKKKKKNDLQSRSTSPNYCGGPRPPVMQAWMSSVQVVLVNQVPDGSEIWGKQSQCCCRPSLRVPVRLMSNAKRNRKDAAYMALKLNRSVALNCRKLLMMCVRQRCVWGKQKTISLNGTGKQKGPLKGATSEL